MFDKFRNILIFQISNISHNLDEILEKINNEIFLTKNILIRENINIAKINNMEC